MLTVYTHTHTHTHTTQIFHKLLTLERFVQDQAPVIRPTGEEREFIMAIRRGPLEVCLGASVGGHN